MTKPIIKEYLNNKGQRVVIADMVDAYLLNSYAYYKKRMGVLKIESFMSEYDVELAERVEALKAEINRRKLI